MPSHLFAGSTKRFTLALLGVAWAAAALVLLMASAAGMVLDRPFGDFSRWIPSRSSRAPRTSASSRASAPSRWSLGCGACLVGALTLDGRARLALRLRRSADGASSWPTTCFSIHEAYIESVGLPMIAAPIIYAGLAIGVLRRLPRLPSTSRDLAPAARSARSSPFRGGRHGTRGGCAVHRRGRDEAVRHRHVDELLRRGDRRRAPHARRGRDPSRRVTAAAAIRAVVFDMDGVIIDSEHIWDEVREQLARDWDGTYGPEAQRAMMGMSAPEWSAYMRDAVGIAAAPEEINAEVVRRMRDRYHEELPVLPGAVEAVRRLREAGLRLAVASSSNRELIEAVLETLELTDSFEQVVSSEEVPRGKPAPDVYLEATRRLGLDPGALRSGRGLDERPPRRRRGRARRRRLPEPPLPAGGGRARASGPRRRLARRAHARDAVGASRRRLSVSRRVRAGRTRCGRRAPSRSRARRRPRRGAPRSGRSRGRTPDRGSGS